jgi:hypothetical protein
MDMQNLDISTASVVAGVVIANLGLIISAYVSIKVSIAELKVIVGTLNSDVDALGDKVREVEKLKR